ncbi:MAG: hypothetical protein JW969_20230 [Spirochaetales bacterium]|nr:hypothetical protein [Spirochaetales bacterium]
MKKENENNIIKPFSNLEKFTFNRTNIGTFFEIRKPAIKTLIQSLNYNYYPIRRSAKESLIKIGKPAAKDLVRAIIKHNGKYRRVIANILDKIEWEPENTNETVYYLLAKRQWEKVKRMGTDVIPILMPLLDHDDPLFRKRIEHILLKLCSDNLGTFDLKLIINHFKHAKNQGPAMQFFSKFLIQVRTVILGRNIFNMNKGYICNPFLADFLFPLNGLKNLMIDIDTMDHSAIDQFVTYAINTIGEVRMKRTLNVVVKGEKDKLPAIKRNLLLSLSKTLRFTR